MQSDHTLDAAILFLVSRCRNLRRVEIGLGGMFHVVTERIENMLSERPMRVRVSINKLVRLHCLLPI